MRPFIASATASLTSTTSSQTVALPPGTNTLVVYNGAANPVYMAFKATVAIPATLQAGEGVFCVQPGSTQAFAKPFQSVDVSYIAATAGGVLVLSVGEGF